MNRNLTTSVVTVAASGAVAAGTSLVTSSSVKVTPNFQGVRGIVYLGALTAGQQTRAKLQISPDNTTWYDLAGTGSGTNGSGSGYAADGDSNKLLITEAFRPGYPAATGAVYVRVAVERGTQNAAIAAIIIELFLAALEPVTQDSSVSKYSICVAPINGTA